MPIYHVTKFFSWTFEVEADNPEQAEALAHDDELSGADLIDQGYTGECLVNEVDASETLYIKARNRLDDMNLPLELLSDDSGQTTTEEHLAWLVSASDEEIHRWVSMMG